MQGLSAPETEKNKNRSLRLSFWHKGRKRVTSSFCPGFCLSGNTSSQAKYQTVIFRSKLKFRPWFRFEKKWDSYSAWEEVQPPPSGARKQSPISADRLPKSGRGRRTIVNIAKFLFWCVSCHVLKTTLAHPIFSFQAFVDVVFLFFFPFVTCSLKGLGNFFFEKDI